MSRLDSTAENVARGKTGSATDARPSPTCLECGGTYERNGRKRDFCRPACRAAWNNRRMKRGAVLFDLIMTVRFDRKLATAFKVWRAINRLAALYRDEDVRRRGGRKSWRRLSEVRADHVYLWHE